MAKFRLFARCVAWGVLLFFCGAAITWSASVIPVFRADTAAARVAAAIIAGEPYQPDELAAFAAQLSSLDSESRASTLADRAIIRLRLAENAIASGDQAKIDAQLDQLSRDAAAALRAAPTDSFQWLVRAFVEQYRNGFTPVALEALRMSYKTGPNEGWVAARRSAVALSNFAALPSDLAAAAVNEFAGMVRSQAFDGAAAILASLEPSVRNELLVHVANLKEVDRRALARALDARDIDVKVPGMDRHPERPWQR